MKRLQYIGLPFRRATVAILLFQLLSPSARATPGSFWAIETIMANGDHPGTGHSIVTQNIGGQQPHVLHVAFSQKKANGLVGVRYACRNLSKAGWKFSTDISTGYKTVAGPRISVLPDGRVSNATLWDRDP